jgi:hypothetical protein
VRYKKSRAACILFVAILSAILFSLPGCQKLVGPAGPAGKTVYDTLVIKDSLIHIDTIFHKDTIIINTHDTTRVVDTVIHRDTTVKNDTTYMNLSCLVCHNTAKLDSITAQYQMSYHFTRGVVNNSNRYCERCHTSEGFQEISQDGLAAAQAAIPSATRIGCATCHQMKSFDLIDTVACILRTVAPVVLNYGNAFSSTGAWTTQKTTDFGEAANLCASCHQIRGATSFTYMDTMATVNGAANANKAATDKSFTLLAYFPVSKYAPTDTVQYKNSTSFAVHDGNQTNVDKGVNAYEYPLANYSGKDTASWHHLNWDCSDCHIMTKFSAADSTGGHTYRINKKDPNCTTCHNLASLISADSAFIAGKLVALGDLLVSRKIMTKKVNTTAGQLPYTYTALPSHDFYGTVYDTANSGMYYAATASNNSVAPTTGLLTYDNIISWTMDTAHVSIVAAGATVNSSVANYSTRIGRAWKGGELGAAYNFGFVYNAIYQHSFGIHNPAYIKSVLQASIDWLTANP